MSRPGRVLDGLASELSREGLLEALLAEDVITRALREAPTGTGTTRRWTRR